MLTHVNEMKVLPQELEVWYIIPAIRKSLSKCLIKEFEISYEKVGNILGISKAAVSQYMKNKRATKIKLHDKVDKQIMSSCKNIMNKKSPSVDEIQRIIQFIKDKQLPSEVCGKLREGVLDDCKEIYLPKN